MRRIIEIVHATQDGKKGCWVRIKSKNGKIVWITPGFYNDERDAHNAITFLGYDPADARIVDE